MKLVILDRDGVINKDSATYIKHPDEWIPITGSLEAIAKLNHANYRVVVATNQSGLGRGLFNIDQLHAIHQKMFDALAQQGGYIDSIFFCPHTPDENCGCRKPKPGLLLEIADRLNIDLSETIFIGDSLKDIQAAQNAGAKAALVLTGNGKTTISQLNDSDNIPTYNDLASAVDALIATTK